MGLQHEEVAPRSFQAALQPNFLGDPQVVIRLVAQFLAESEGDLYALAFGQLESGAYEETNRARVIGMADVFGGRDENFRGPDGWNDISLPGSLIPALGEFWSQRHEEWADDPVAVLFEWLLVRLADAFLAADGDDLVLQGIMSPHATFASRLLLGTTARRT